MKKNIIKFWWVIPLSIVFIVGIFLIWASTPLAPMPEAELALTSDSFVDVDLSPWLQFTPTNQTPSTGIIIYPGGKVAPEAYASLARGLAERGYLTVIVPMPLNLAVFAPRRAADVIASFPEIEHWIIAGHSLGGSMAAKFANDNPGQVDGLVLLAAYPSSADDLSNSPVIVASITGTEDGLVDAGTLEDSRPLLPANTSWVLIPGGNHSQFGYYGDQSGDNPATISRQQQQQETINVIEALIKRIQSSSI